MKINFADQSPEAVRARHVDNMRIVGGLVVDTLCVLSWQFDDSTIGNKITAGAVIVASAQMIGPVIRSALHTGHWEQSPFLSSTPKSEM